MSPSPRSKRERSAEAVARLGQIVSEAQGDPSSHAGFFVRLSALIVAAGSALALAEKVGVSDSTIHLWLHGSEPSREKLIALARAGNVSVEWLATGSGAMRPRERLPDGYVLVPRYPRDTKDTAIEGVDFLALKEDWIKSLPGSPSPTALLLTRVTDDTMAPTFNVGDLVLVNFADRQERGGIFALVPVPTAHELIIRRIHDLGDGRYQLLCDNTKYPPGAPETADKLPRRFKVFGRVIWSGGLV